MLALISIFLAATNPYFDAGQRLSGELKFAEAIEQLKVARQVPGQSEDQQVDVLELLARCFVAEGRRAEAQSTYEELLVLRPSFAPDRALSPKILETFDAAKEKVFSHDYFKLEPLPAPPGRARLRIIDPWQRAASFELSLRIDTEPGFEKRPLPVDAGALTVMLVGAPLHTLEWFVTAFDENGAVVGGYGSAAAPQRHTVPTVAPEARVASDARPRVQRWPAWFALGLGLVSAIVGAAFELNSQSRVQQLQDRTRAPGDWADTARATQELAVRDATIAAVMFGLGGAAGAVGVVVFAW
ncbi:MAG: hypothetical protein IPJ65_00175 [Archangiaceae bacterium]|nr:hypothetical protein [Archangiaceae bacterium]